MTRTAPARFATLLISLLLAGCPGDEDETGGSADTGASEGSASAGSSDGGVALGCAADVMSDPLYDTTDGMTNPLMETWGAPCSTNADCVALLGAGAECLFLAVAYELPGGFCSKPCEMPDGVTFVLDDPACDQAGGVACIGQAAVNFEYCGVPCTDDQQCNREGYMCRRLPQISMEGDPSFCLMPDCCGDNGTCDPGD